MKKLMELYEAGGHWIASHGKGYDTKHMMWRVVVILYSVPLIVWFTTEEALKAVRNFSRELYYYIRFNR